MNVNCKFTDINSYIKNILLLLTLVVLGATEVWAQTSYSGTYYIANNAGYKVGTPATNWYLVPADDGTAKNNYRDAYYSADQYKTAGDPEKPFLTTYQTNKDNAASPKRKDNSIWVLEPVSGESGYYYIKHFATGRYVIYEPPYSAKPNRKSMHLLTTDSPGENAKFEINASGNIRPKSISSGNRFLNPANKNNNTYNAFGGNDGGVLDYYGLVGLWSDASGNSIWKFENAAISPNITVTSAGDVQMAMSSGYESLYDIYYTIDGSAPNPADASDPSKATKAFSTNLLHDDIKNYAGSAIKAVAKRKSDGLVSNVVTLPLVNYTYKVVNQANAIAITYTIKEAVGKPLSGYSSIPEAIRSMYVRKETITFRSFDVAFSTAALEAADALTETPSTSNIYITYTMDHLGEETLHLRGAHQMNIKAGENGTFDNIYDSGTAGSGVLAHDAIAVTDENRDHLWLVNGNDPYALTIRNVNTHNYLHYATPSTLSLDASPSYFILMAGADDGVHSVYEQMELMAATGDGNYYRVSRSGDTFSLSTAAPGGAALQIQVYPQASSLTYILIDRAGKEIASVNSTSGELRLPDELWSPLVSTYHYWKDTSFNVSAGVYTLKSGEEEVDDISEVSGSVYVTYDVSDAINITGGTTYLLEFSEGVNFKPEDGNNGVSGTAIKPVYPYNNGDFNLYIYGADEWTAQLSNGASTRTRWLWYLVSNHDGTDLTGDAADPYHIIVKSRQNQSYKVGSNLYPGNAYFYTFKHNSDVVTGVITQHDVVKTLSPELAPTEYMLLGTDLSHLTLKTVNEIDGERRTVDKFEQYWKNYPTVQTVAGVQNPAADNATLTGEGWHRYENWAYAEPWGGGTKTYEKGNHWFQTVSMGSGNFTLEEVRLEPDVILLDQHGWEIMRVPMSQKAKLKNFDSPMVQQYHWYPSAFKTSGYHKFDVSSQEIIVYDASGNATEDTYIHNSTSLADIPYDHAPINNQIDKVKADFYVTYTVKSDYAGTYEGAATEGSVKASSFFVKQGGKYAQNSSNTIALVDKPSLTGEIPTNVQWKVKPNFNIDEEMGYKYFGETGALPEAESKDDMEGAYHLAGRNGFDPYNVQIQSVSNTARYFTANTSSTAFEHGVWTGTGSTTISLREMSVGHISAEGNDHVTLDITNATFMVVDDGNGNMRLMPRFDNTKVMTSFTGLSEQLAAAAAGNNGEGTQSLVIELVPTVVSSTDDIISMKGYYILTEDFELNSSIGSKTTPFEGTLDGQLYQQTFDKPLVLYAKDATICNIILTGSTLSSGNEDGHLGAIACTAQGNTRIYNCGILAGSLSETEHVGGIVGHLQDYSRVINCYSYATIAGGSNVGGIVGYNNYASTASDLRTMVMNCAFYGDITGGGTKSPVYGGYNIANTGSGLNNYNYYAYAQLPTDHITNNMYNTALAVSDEDFKRFEFYRLLLNSNKRLAAYYATGSAANDWQMAKWVLETADRTNATPKAYPVLKAQGYYPSIINYDVENAPDSASVGRNKGGKLGKTLTIHLSGTGITTTSLTVQRTDKDFDRYNFNYDKIQLPYFNEVGTGNYTSNRVVTGWEITSMTGGTAGTYSTADAWGGYNFADRKCTNKDLVGTSGRIFSEGAYFDVPYGVTDIYIQPHWATAAYVADEYLDVVYDAGFGKHPVTALGNSFKQFPTGKITIGGSEQTVYTSISSAISSFSAGSVYDYAVVLVGNLHQSDVPLKDDSKAFTMMSVDLDNDHEPDYSMIYHHTNRMRVCPIRFDFLNVIGTSFAQKPNGAELLLNTTIFKTSGWFEVTNTALMYSNQMEYENLESNAKSNAPLILLGGKFDQFVSTQRTAVTGKTIYIHVGGNVWIDQFGLGTHSDGSQSTPHVPVSVTGGEYKGFYLTGTYNQDAAVRTDDAECYISGGHFVEAAGACQEAINGNVRWQIYNADIDAFYGGGINAAKPIAGNITTEIINSYVTTFCGGPKFGDMQTGKDVRTTATGCVFEKYYGAGYGGTSYSRKKYYDEATYNFSSLQSRYTSDRGKYYDGKTTGSSITSGKDYGKKGPGEATDFDYEFFVWSTGKTGARFFVKFASFSLANCIDVYSTLNNCTINQNFYGGGSFGSVSGTANSELNNCLVHGNVFGGGYSAVREKVPVRNSGFTNIPKYNSQSGMFEPGTFSGTTEYEWKHVNDLPANGQTGIEDSGDNHYLYTDVDLDALGKVGNTVLTIQGNTVVEGKIFEYDSNGKVLKDGAGNNIVAETTGGVFGGGDMSAVNHSTQVTVEATGAAGVLNIFGGGNTADVLENTLVTITGGTVGNTSAASDTNGNVYGGGKGASTLVGGNVTVNLGTKTGSAPSFTYTGNGLVKHNVYGGSALGSVNTTPNASSVYDKTTAVNIYAGTVNGSVFGGGLGHDDADAANDIVAKNYGNTTVTVENSDNANALVKTAVYGGANENGVVKGNTTVTITGGTVGTVPEGVNPITNVVFGGGLGEPTLVEGSVEVNIGSERQSSGGAAVNGHVYGGGALGSVNASKSGSDPMVFNTAKTTHVNLYKGLIKGNVYGGGLGQKASLEPVKPAIAAYVGGDVQVLLDGAQLECAFTGSGVDLKPLKGQIFGCNNLNGTPKGHVKVWVKRTVGTDKSSVEALAKTRDERGGTDPYSYDVAAVYGGGNQADYIPADTELDPDEVGHEEENRTKINNANAEVLIEGCDLTSIEYVYGGGNAAAVPATDVTILGTYIIDYVFGGGNGKGTGNPGANIGSYNNGATNYGSGKAVTKLVGGHIMYVFGGSNTKGNVRGGTSISMPDKASYVSEGHNCCTVRDIKEIYGAGNEAEQDGPVTMIVGCVDNMDYVYGGARNAHVKGGVDLVITSGHFRGVFGGNDTAGSIQGPITVTIEETGCEPLVIDNLYLGGNQAAYSIYGYKDVSGTLVARTQAEYDALTTEQKTAEGLPYANPVMNVVSCTSIGNVFGGGLGTTAVMYGSPTVNINMIPGDYGADTDSDGKPDALGTIGNVYGGGEEANVDGNTAVNICTAETVTVRTHMGAPVTNEPTAVMGALITGNVFGAGKGETANVNSALVTGNTTITMAGGSVTKSVYGGGQLSQVGGNTNVMVSGGTIGKDREGASEPYTYYGGAEYGNVYGAGLGSESGVGFGLVKGNTNITIQNVMADAAWVEAHPDAGRSVGDVLSTPTIYHNIYGGGALASVGTYTYNASNEITGHTDDTGKATITITGGTIGIDGHGNGMVFGSSRGEIDAPNAIHDKLAWVYDTEVNIGTPDAASGPTIHGSLYGGGENGHVYNDAVVTMNIGTVGNPAEYYADRGDVYGAGCGTDMYYSSSIPVGHTAHDGKGDKYNPIAGIVRNNATVIINGGDVANNVYGAGSMGKVLGNTSVTINTDGSIGVDGNHDDGNVYGAARGELDLTGKIPAEDNVHNYSTVNNSNVTLTKGTVKGSLYGGGKAGEVTGAVSVTLSGGTVSHDVYGGGALAKTNTAYDAVEHPTYTTSVTMNGSGSGCTIQGNLYGGGLGRLHEDAVAADPEHGIEARAEVTAVEADVNGPVVVTVSNGKAANVFGCNNLNGSPKQTAAVVITKTADVISGSAISNVYGGGNIAAYTGTGGVSVAMSGGTAGYVYGGGLGATAVVNGSTSVAISQASSSTPTIIANDVYGGGSQADVTGSVNVSVSGGKVVEDVYGGGALANTNTANWTLGALSPIYVDITSVLTIGTTTVTGLYTESGGVYTEITGADIKASSGTNYYERRMLPGDWAAGKTSASNTTTVTLTGGIIGNVYGGGLGNSTTPVYVFGDITVNVNKPSDMTVSSPGAAFHYKTETPVIAGQSYAVVPVHGNVFGCNNINGTPLGNVEVGVYSTRQIDNKDNYLEGHSPNGVVKTYEIQTVYGGGNLADYIPAAGKGTKVIIDGCGETSISNVYGGGSSASVPNTDVTIWGTYDIGYAFGGGNGFYKVKKNGVWTHNDGAGVNGLAKITCHGGKIGEIFGGSDAKGDCLGTSVDQTQDGICPLIITKLYGAGKETNVDGDVNVVINACTGRDSQIEYVCGGSYKAHISGDVNLTITNGFYKNVFGGNDQRGGIGGDITVNIEETEDCVKPLIIQNLVGGSNKADYPGTDKNEEPFTIDPENPRKITVNVKSATRIDNIFGGSFLAEANADTEVNILMIRGNKSGSNDAPLPAYYGEAGALIPSNITGVTVSHNEVTGLTVGTSSVIGYYEQKAGDKYELTSDKLAQSGKTYYELSVTGDIKAGIGTIGNIYGGGNEGEVKGSSVVNIGTSTTVPIMKRVGVDNTGDIDADVDGSGKITAIRYINKPVLGANIEGDVFGGGYVKDVTGNATVNISTVDHSGTTGFEGISIGGTVYGGGYEADVLKNTSVTMSGGYVFNGIFGGGYAGSVGTFTRSTDAEDTGVYGHVSHAGCIGKPTDCAVGTGKCTVVVNGGQVGPIEVATLGMKRLDADGGPVPEGWIWGGSRGLIEDPLTNPDTHFKSYVNETEVTIGGTAFILESVIGGGEFGRVLGNTLVKIEGGQIGVGDGEYNEDGEGNPTTPKRYDDDDFINPATATAAEIETAAAKLPECSHFDYGRTVDGQKVYLPYDPYYKHYSSYVTANPEFGPATTGNASDGKTWIGCVFGGGSGFFPYVKADGSGYDWCRSAGWVEGNTEVRISGGHILTNVYGANEYTDVGGKATVKMTGGTIGVPRTLEQIAEHPLSCYLFGAGKGDQRTHFYNYNNVGSVEVDVSGGIIYGSVFGGAEDGHVLGDVLVKIRKGDNFTIGSTTYTNGPVIGTWGTSYYDGNVFGGGRGYGGTDYTAGNVAGSINVNISGGTMLGSVYGGGRLGSVGYGMFKSGDAYYGRMLDDDKMDDGTDGSSFFTKGRGHIDIDIDGSTNDVVIGNKYEFQHHPTEGSLPYMPSTDATYDSDRGYYMLNHTRGGNVFGGGMGRREKMGSTTEPITELMWQKLGRVKSTKLNIHGSRVWIKGNVYGGGEFGAVTGKHKTGKDVSTEIIINGATIGTVMGSDINNGTPSTGIGTGDTRYSFGSVYGGGYGTMADVKTVSDGYAADIHTFAALVGYDTDITMTSGNVRGSIYGGGELACVEGGTNVVVNGGSIGVGEVKASGYVLFGNWRMGNVFGGGKGDGRAVNAGLVAKNATVSITGGNVYHNVYGGGAIGSVGTYTRYTDDEGSNPIPAALKAYIPIASPKTCADGTGTATVTITGGQIGINGWDNGMVNGSGRGDVTKPGADGFDNYDRMAWVKESVVSIGNSGSESVYTSPQPQIKGSLYGGGENGHNFGNSTVHVYSGTIGTNSATSYDNGNVYGSGRGTDTYWDDANDDGVDDPGEKHHNRTAGFVRGSSSVNIHGGKILNSVYGGGSMASIGEHGERATLNISGGVIQGSIYGGPKGDLKDRELKARAKQTVVNISGGTIEGSAYGGGMAGIVENSVTVNMTGGMVGNNVYGGGAFADTNTENWTDSFTEETGLTVGTSDVTGLYEKESTYYFLTSDFKAVSGKKYYSRGGEWATGKTSASNTTTLNLRGGTIGHDAYGGALGQFARDDVGTENDLQLIEPMVFGDILVELNKNVPTTGQKGCVVEKVFGCNDMCGTPKGHVQVHIHATQHKNKTEISDKYDKYPKVNGYSIKDYSGLTALASTYSVDVSSYTATLAGSGTDAEKETALANMETAVEAAVYASYASTLGVNLTGLTELADQREAISDVKYDVQAVYGGGNLAPYVPLDAFAPDDATRTNARAEVIIDGCELTSIKEVYGSGNAASTPGSIVSVYGTHEIDELFGGGNGKENYAIYGKWYENPGANVGYHNYTHYDTGGSHGDGASDTDEHRYEAIENDDASSKDLRVNNYGYGSGQARTDVVGGRIHNAYGGSNMKGNIRYMALSVYDDIGDCPLEIDKTYGAGKSADIDGEVRVQLSCVEYMSQLFGGSTYADVNSDVTLTVTNGTFDKVFGGNDRSGTITGSITVNVIESGCRPIIIGELYGGGNYAPYSVYGYNGDKSARTKAQYEAAVTAAEDAYKALHPDATRAELDEELMRLDLYGFPKRDPQVNVISATKIGTIYGGGLGAEATVVGSPYVNVNMERGKVVAKYANNADNSIRTEYTVAEHTDARGDKYTVYSHEAGGDAILEIGTIGDIFGGGDNADIIGNTSVDIGTGKHYNADGELVTIEPARNAAFITGNVYGGSKMGHVGDFTKNGSGKPVSCAAGTGKCIVTISNGEIGPNDMKMVKVGGPDDKGHVFGAGQGSNLPANDNAAYVDSTLLTINGTAWVKGSVYGGSENGHVLHDTHVIIDGDCQIGNGHLLIKDGESTIIDRGLNRRFTNTEWTNNHLTVTSADFTTAELTETPTLVDIVNTEYAASLPECTHWPYGKDTNGDGENDTYNPHDIYGIDGDEVASDGHTFYGNVFGGGSGYYPYASNNWNMKAGWVEGNTKVEIKGGHILTSAYGGNEMTNVGSGLTADKGKCTVIMTGGTLGVPRTLAQIDAHPVTCYLFGGGKGDQHAHFNEDTNVKEVEMEITGGYIYGSVFGGGEDGHVLGDVKMTIGNIDGTGPTIGTLGSSYVDGNVFGGGRGFSGEVLTAGNVGGSINLNIKGGTMLGSVYGGGRLGSVGYGLYAPEHANYGVMRDDDKTDNGATTDYYTTTGMNKNGRGNIVINISGGTIGNNIEYVYVNEDNADDIVGKGNIAKTEFSDFASFREKVTDEGGLITEAGSSTRYRRLSHTKGGSVFGGCMGRIYKLDGTAISNWNKLAHAKSTTVNVSGNAHIKSTVFGGSELGQVEGNTEVNVSGTPVIGTEVYKAGYDAPQYGFGSLYGGGYGSDVSLSSPLANPREFAGQVGGSSTVNMSGGTVKSSVYGGGKNATINGNTYVNISGGEVGMNKVRKDDGYVMYGSSNQGNVYGGGKGSLINPQMGIVKGNTNVNITGGNIYHMVYGGGALASVGTFDLSTGTVPDYIPIKNVPYNWTVGTGTTNVTITGGTIGISGHDNGFVFGSSRGDIKRPEADANEGGKLVDPYDREAWVKNSVVKIGREGAEPTDADYLTTPIIKGSVYGGGENGHNSETAEVNIYSGTIGITDTNDKWYDYMDELTGKTAEERETLSKKYQTERGNVYGAGSGSDTYTGVDGKEHYNPKSGMVGKSTEVNIYGGHIGRSVYGGGSMAMVGTIINSTDTLDVSSGGTGTAKHVNEANGFVLSWPYKFVFAPNTGKATINITGGHVGTRDIDGGDVFGGARGKAGDRYATAHLAYVKEAEVNVNYDSQASESDMPNIKTDFLIPCVTGSVSGSGEDGYVYGDTHVTLNKGLIGHSLYGAGKGNGTYTQTLSKIGDSGTYEAKVYSLIAGKVFGNTYVTMNGGYVGRNVYGGGNMASVGKGSFASGADDYANDCALGAAQGYGEKITGNLWTSASEGDNAWEFLNSGKTTVNVISGTVGYIDPTDPSKSMKNQLPYGNVIGGSAGESAPNIAENPRYLYSPAFFSGYVNETDVTIGGYRCKTAYTDDSSKAHAVGEVITAAEYKQSYTSDAANWEIVGPTIRASVYGGGQDGHVRRDTKVTVLAGEIGKPYNEANISLLKTSDIDSPQWVHRGNVYGGGSGITKYQYDFNYDGDTEDEDEEDYSSSSGSVTRFTEVNILGGTIHRNVYGGGSMGSVGAPNMGQTYDLYKPGQANIDGKPANGPGRQSMCTVNIAGTIGSPTGYKEWYGGEVFGAGRGLSSLKDKADEFSYSIWTLVNVLDGAWIKGSVFGGGDNGLVKKNAEVMVGAPTE